MEYYYYYFVSINYPFLAKSKGDARKLLEKAEYVDKESKPFDMEEFCVVSSWRGREFYHLYQFGSSVPASKAGDNDFVITKTKVDSSDILPETQRMIIDVDFKFITLSHATAAVDAATAAVDAATAAVDAATAARTSALMSVHDLIMKNENKESILEHILKETRCPLQHHVPVQTSVDLVPIQLDEITMNVLVFKAISDEAEKMGFTVATNTSGSQKSKYSKYYKSRPDLAMYKNNFGYIVIDTGASQESETPTAASEESETPTAAISEKGDAVGQLLAGMDKLAGDLAFEQLRSDKPAKDRLFRYIIIYGLVINYDDHSCTPYKLTMDFDENSSKLNTGKQQLPLEEGITRLLSKLEQTTA